MLLNGLMGDTPLGRVVDIRSEKDSKVICKMTAYEKRIRADWIKFKHEKNNPVGDLGNVEDLQKIFAQLFGQKQRAR